MTQAYLSIKEESSDGLRILPSFESRTVRFTLPTMEPKGALEPFVQRLTSSYNSKDVSQTGERVFNNPNRDFYADGQAGPTAPSLTSRRGVRGTPVLNRQGY
jgi:hypothetical protein